MDRSHNRDTLSSEAMTEMLRDLQDTVVALDERLGNLEAAHGHVAVQTRTLAIGVAQMGEALSSRVRALEEAEAPPPAPPAPDPEPALFLKAPTRVVRQQPERRAAWTAGLGVLLALILGALWLWRSEILDHAQPISAPPAASAPAPPAATVVTPAPPKTSSSSTAVHPANHSPTVRNSADSRTGAEHDLASDSQTADKPPSGFVLYSQNAATTGQGASH